MTLRNRDGALSHDSKPTSVQEQAFEKYTYSKKEFFTLETPSGGRLNAWMIKPVDFDENKTYPLFMFVYGGPGSQTVMNSYDAFRGMWFQMLANEHDMIVVSVENHGTDGRSEDFKKSTYGQMGKLETRDQTEAALELAKRSYIDGNRIGVFGWSYGGYMASNLLFQSPEVFKMAVAVAPGDELAILRQHLYGAIHGSCHRKMAKAMMPIVPSRMWTAFKENTYSSTERATIMCTCRTPCAWWKPWSKQIRISTGLLIRIKTTASTEGTRPCTCTER